MSYRLAVPALSVLAVVVAVSPARADEATQPKFVTIDRQSADTMVVADMNVTTDTASVNARFARFDLYGQWINDQGFGAYLSVPFTQSLIDGSFEDTVLGNGEIGYTHNLAVRDDIELNVRAGLLMPTAGGEFSRANTAGALGRITDLATASRDVVWLRMSASPTLRAQYVFVRADVGADIPVQESKTFDASPLVRTNLAAGVHLAPVAFTAEFASVYQVDAPGNDPVFHQNGALTAQFDAGRGVSPTLSFTLPLDERRRGTTWTLGAGVQARFKPWRYEAHDRSSP